jgi:phage tail sheath protein FI
MPQKMSTPGIYLKEVDQSNIITAGSTSVGGTVIRSTKGPINRPYLVQSDKDIIDTFGQPIFVSGSSGDGVTPEYGYGLFGALEFIKESNALYIVRDYDTNDKYASVLFDSNGSTSATSATGVGASNDSNVADKSTNIYSLEHALPTGKSLLIGAIGPGTDGNNIAITVQTYSSACDWVNTYDTYTSGTLSAGTRPVAEKVFKLQVFVKGDTDNWSTISYADISGTPAETFYGSISSQVDGNKKQLKIDDIVNGNSAYIYTVASSTDFYASGLKSSVPTSATPLVGGAVAIGTNLGTTDGWSYFQNKTDVSVNILILPDWDMTVKKYVANICNLRKDCIMVAQSGGLSATSTLLVTGAETYGYTNPSYMALYGGWDEVYDTYNDKLVYIPKCIYGAALMARTDRVANVWDAPAGIDRGVLPSVAQNKVWSEAEVGTLYDVNINTSLRIKGSGDIMWGQKTAQLKHSALDRINVRRLVTYIENSIQPALLPFVFQINNSTNRLRAFNICDSFLSQIKAGGGLDDYKVVCDSSNNPANIIDQNILAVDVAVSPAKTGEFITLTVTINRTGVNVVTA